MVKIALLQIESTNTLKGNLEKGVLACRKAKEEKADIALFPEMYSDGYLLPHDLSKLNELAITSNDSFVLAFKDLAQELSMAIGITFLEKTETGFRNSICLFDRFGKEVYKYSKVHTCNFDMDNDESVLEPGDDFVVSDLDVGSTIIKVGSMICYDREFPESARNLMLKGAELILVPNACPMEINRLSQLRGRTYENYLAIATCNYPVSHPDCNGHSSLFDGVVYLPELKGSRDTCMLLADENEGIYVAELDIDQLREYREREFKYYLNNRKPEIYIK